MKDKPGRKLMITAALAVLSLTLSLPPDSHADFDQAALATVASETTPTGADAAALPRESAGAPMRLVLRATEEVDGDALCLVVRSTMAPCEVLSHPAGQCRAHGGRDKVQWSTSENTWARTDAVPLQEPLPLQGSIYLACLESGWRPGIG